MLTVRRNSSPHTATRSPRPSRYGPGQPDRRAWRTWLVAAALAATLITLGILIGLEIAGQPQFRAHTNAAVRACLRHHRVAGTALPGLAGCLARRQTPPEDPYEVAGGVALTALAVAETRYLVRRRHTPPA